MQLKKITCGKAVLAEAVPNEKELLITDAQSAMDILLSAKYDVGTCAVMIDKRYVAEDFFILSTGLAGEILQKFINYGGKIAIYGDYSRYTSKPLQDFIRESNKSKDVFFPADAANAAAMLAKAME